MAPAPKHQLNLPPALVSSHDVRPSIDCTDEVNSVAIPQLLRAAIECSGVQHKECAYAAGMQPDHWVRVLNGERGIPLDRLGLLPLETQRIFVASWARALQLRVTSEDATRQKAAALVKAAADYLSETA